MFEIRHFLVLFAVCFGIGYSVAQCPPEILIRPCKCESELIPIINCEEITEMAVLEDVFRRSGDREFNVFNLINSSIMYLPATSISTKHFKVILLFNVTMTAMFDALPYEENEITLIGLSNVTFQRGVGWELFRPMKKLELFQSDYTEIKSLGKSFTDNINRDIETIVLMNSKTKKIQYNAFADLEKLSTLEITGAEIKKLQRSMFANPSALERIDFSGNKIESLPDDLFVNMPRLQKVTFDNNKLTTVSEPVFGYLYHHSGFISLTGNPLACNCKMFWFVVNNNRRILGRCASPEDQEGKNLPNLREKDLEYCKY